MQVNVNLWRYSLLVGLLALFLISCTASVQMSGIRDEEIPAVTPAADTSNISAHTEQVATKEIFSTSDLIAATDDGGGITAVIEDEPVEVTPTVAGLNATAPAALPTVAPRTVTSQHVACEEVSRPAILAASQSEAYVIVDPVGKHYCTFEFDVEPVSTVDVVVAGDTVYYETHEWLAEGPFINVWRLNLDGADEPVHLMAFADSDDLLQSYTFSDDGRKVAWSAIRILEEEAAGTQVLNTVWVANSDGSEVVQVLQEVVTWPDPAVSAELARYLKPVRFTPNNSTLFYTWQPRGLGGWWGAYVGRYDNLSLISVTGGAPELLFDCQTVEDHVQLCIGDFTSDGGVIAYTDTAAGAVNLVSRDGTLINSFTASVYTGYPTFNSRGDLAFYVAQVDQASGRLQSGTIKRVAPPYDGQAETLVQGNSVFLPRQWWDDGRLLFIRQPTTGESGLGFAGLFEDIVDTPYWPPRIYPENIHFIAIIPGS